MQTLPQADAEAGRPEAGTGTYEVLRERLAGQARELARRAEALNARRVAEFGATRLRLTGTEQLRTEHPSVPRDLVALGDVLLVGHAVGAGPARPAGPAVGDVFALHGRDLERLPEDTVPGLLDDPAFVREFGALFRYFGDARLLRLRRTEDGLLAVFRTGESTDDIRLLRWSLSGDGRATFLDASGDRASVRRGSPGAHDVEWTAVTRDDQVLGRHPHLSVGGGFHVSTVGGFLTVKAEDDTETGEGIHSEPVDEPLQALADAEVEHARVGPLLLLRVRPYNEERRRHLVVHTLNGTVVRLDGIGQACRRLPDDQGIVFPGGYCLASGAYKTFDLDTAGLEYERTVHSPNGEDVLYVFHARVAGRGLLLPYNTIRKEVAAPLSCHGHAVHDDGTLVVLRGGREPARVHPLQVWASPFVSDTHAAAQSSGRGPLGRIGNADLVRAVSECLAVAAMVTEITGTAGLYESLAAACTRPVDTYHWLGDEAVGDLRGPLDALRETAGQVLAEFETVAALTGAAADALGEAAARNAALVRRIRGEAPQEATEWIGRLAELRTAQGQLEALGELRYADTARLDELAADLTDGLASAGRRAVAFLARQDAFAAQHAETERLAVEAADTPSVAAAAPVRDRLQELTDRLGTVTEVVTGLDIGDATVRTAVLEHIAEVLAGVNRARATLDARCADLRSREGRAEFAAEFSLLGQAVTGALAAAVSPEACDGQLAGLLVRVENLQARFVESDAFLAELDAKRDEVCDVFASRKQTLQDARARHAERLAQSAERILVTVARRVASLGSTDEIHTYFASDPMVVKVRRTCDELRELGEQVRAQELAARITDARQDAARALRDRTELYADGGAAVRLGRHRFPVSSQPVDLTLVPYQDGAAFAVTGTDYRAPVTDGAFAATRPYWEQSLVSETAGMYRAEHLAAKLLADHGTERLTELTDAELRALVREAAEAAYDEGYERGVHDHDAALILAALVRLHAGAGLLRFPARERAAAQLFWAHGAARERRDAWEIRARSLARARAAFGGTATTDAWERELTEAMGEFLSPLADAGAPSGEVGRPATGSPRRTGMPVRFAPGWCLDGVDLGLAATYLFEELASAGDGFVTGGVAGDLLAKYRRALDGAGYEDDLARLTVSSVRQGDVGGLRARWQLVEAWLASYAAASGDPAEPGDLAEAVAAELCPGLARRTADAPLAEHVDGLLGGHPRIRGRRLTVRIDELTARARDFRERVVPGFRSYQKLRARLVAEERTRLRLDDFRPAVPAGFVRGRLVDQVYLPLVGDNLAKQFGAAGGLLLLVSPPGYGKTTLMEYVAARLGLVMVRVNGPALGHRVTSLDPADAPDAAARREIEKIGFAFEAGNNVLLYLDDIQHTSPELLQKFIPLCDGQRRVEGVWNGAPRTYDLRGKRFAVCMAGNPYTESGRRFRIPDMLANRADVWNLGDVLTGKEDAFAVSFVENALTAHPVLAPLAGRDPGDLDLLLRLAVGDASASADRLAHPCAPAELDRILRVLRHLLTARATVLAVNTAYIASAGRTDDARTEPPFRLQGSYRDMNKIAARIDPVMNDAELAAVVDDHYAAEAGTLTSGAEANLLRLAELRGTLTPEAARRWAEVKESYVRAAGTAPRCHDCRRR